MLLQVRNDISDGVILKMCDVRFAIVNFVVGAHVVKFPDPNAFQPWFVSMALSAKKDERFLCSRDTFYFSSVFR